MNTEDLDRLRAHVAELEQQLHVTKAILKRAESTSRHGAQPIASLTLGPSLHNTLLLSDSALPLGSFAYSSGLESFIAHNKHTVSSIPPLQLFQQFLKLSINSIATTNVPYLLAAFRDPLSLLDLDNDIDASTPCTVQRRASIAQGRALLSVYEKAFASTARTQFSEYPEAAAALTTFASDLKLASLSTNPLPAANGHLAPLWGVVALTLGIGLEEAAYIFLLNHAKAVVSAGVRASVMGPYQAQKFLAGEVLQGLVKGALERVWFVSPEEAGQSVPSLDLWNGRHELLYSRIFNS